MISLLTGSILAEKLITIASLLMVWWVLNEDIFFAKHCLKLAVFTYSWIGHGLQSGPMLAFLLWLSDFKAKTSFWFLVKKIRDHLFLF